MLDTVKVLAVTAALSLAAGCASPPLPEAERESGQARTAVQSDSTDIYYEDLFLDIYARVLEELKARKRPDIEDMALIEARSMVKIAEEVYLEGKVFLAVKLLSEAELLLRQAP
jgi:hypothetical protein